ncbi:Uncharacterized protein HZ326_22631 [Fusarium oxysporum f. sp. albedinis]|nr:Uncharacterized protein HZ326_22631 [Fusarium oxysporum f. sp. albedinis]
MLDGVVYLSVFGTVTIFLPETVEAERGPSQKIRRGKLDHRILQRQHRLWDLHCKPIEVLGLQAHKQKTYMDPLVASSLPRRLSGAAFGVLNGSTGR